ncbi:hypothetical protein LINGRAHAP2_LOCUS17379, partial [Linum grandiflorum]
MQVYIEDITQPPRTDDDMQVQIDNITQPPRTDDVLHVKADSTIVEEIQQDNETIGQLMERSFIVQLVEHNSDDLVTRLASTLRKLLS